MDIEAYIRRFAAPPAAEIAALVAAARPRRLDTGQDFCALGQERHELAFVHEGILRYYVVRADGEEATKDFSFAGSFAVSYGSAVSGRPAEVAIAAVTPCRLDVWPFASVARLNERHPEWQTFLRRVAEMLYVRKERREIAFLLDDAATRYRAMLRDFPQAADIPQHYLASYLGIRPQSLSRIKKAVSA